MLSAPTDSAEDPKKQLYEDGSYGHNHRKSVLILLGFLKDSHTGGGNHGQRYQTHVQMGQGQSQETFR